MHPFYGPSSLLMAKESFWWAGLLSMADVFDLLDCRDRSGGPLCEIIFHQFQKT